MMVWLKKPVAMGIHHFDILGIFGTIAKISVSLLLLGLAVCMGFTNTFQVEMAHSFPSKTKGRETQNS